MICDFGLSRTLPETCIGKGSGNTKRMRDSIMKQSLKNDYSESKLKKVIAGKLENEKKSNSGKGKRCLSSHVGSRWYRAPEISILENKYDSASDMWSFGCCIFELNKMIQTEAKEKKSHVLFPGTSCYPLSPMAEKPAEDDSDNIISDQDQMKVILRKLGKQDDYDLSFIQTSDALDYVQGLNEEENAKPNAYLNEI